MKSNKNTKMTKGKKQYIVTLVVTLIAIWIIVSITFLSFYFIARSDAETIGKSSLAEQSEKLNNYLLKGMDVIDITKIAVEYMMDEGATSEEILSYLEWQSKEYAENIDKNFTGVYGWIQGEYMDGSGWVPDKNFEPKKRPWYRMAIHANGKPVVISPYLDAKTGDIMLSVSQMLSDGESVVSFDMVTDEMQNFAESINLNGKGYGFIVDAKGLVVAHSDASEKGKNYIADSAMQGTEMQQIVRRVVAGNGETIKVRINGKDSRVFSTVVQDKWYVVMIINVHDLFQRVESNLIINIILSLFIYGVVAYFIASNYKNKRMVLLYAAELKIYQSTLEERVAEQTVEIKEQSAKMVEMQESAVEGMATLIESRDGNTGEHVKSTKKYVSMMSQYMHEHKMYPELMDESYIKKINHAATLHDVGKIRISDVILNKPGKFTPDEYEIMKKHASFGGEIVKEVLGKNADKELVQIAGDVVCYHHEKWDGTGYPEGLKGEEIPLCARIMAVADVFDALVSKRVYKEAMSVEDAFQILEEEAGKHFDPEIVDVFIKLRPQIEEHLNTINM